MEFGSSLEFLLYKFVSEVQNFGKKRCSKNSFSSVDLDILVCHIFAYGQAEEHSGCSNFFASFCQQVAQTC